MRRILAALLLLIPATLFAQNGVTLPAGSGTQKALHFKDYPGLGIYESSAGVMYVGDESGGLACTYGSGCTFSGTVTLARSFLTEEALQPYGIPISSILSNAGAALLAAETADTFDVTVGTNTVLANGEVTDNETETSIAYFQFVLPPQYVAAGDVTIRLPAAIIKTGGATNNASTLDISVYEQTDAGAVGADLCATAAATFAALDTWYNKDFSVTATGLVAGDVLNVKITAAVVDSEAGGGTLILNLAPPKVLIDIKG